jgi:hypothetical protein
MLCLIANVSGCVDWGLGLLPLACWDSGVESRRQHGRLSLMSVVCCQVEVFASDWSHIQRSPSEYGECECDREAWMMMRPWPTRGCCVMEKNVLSDYWLMGWKWSGRIGCVLNDILFFTPTPTPTPTCLKGLGKSIRNLNPSAQRSTWPRFEAETCRTWATCQWYSGWKVMKRWEQCGDRRLVVRTIKKFISKKYFMTIWSCFVCLSIVH